MLVVEVRAVPPILLAVCYCPPDDTPALTAAMTALGEIAAAQPGKTVLAVGDFNVPEVAWTRTDAGCAAPAVTRRSRRADALLDGCHLAGLRQYVSQPTRGDNVLDLALSNGSPCETAVRDGTLPSDHREVECTVRAVRTAVPLVTRQTAFNYKRADWNGLRAALRVTPWSMLENHPVDEAADRFYDLLTAAMRDYIPRVTLRRRQPPWFDNESRTALREKERARRRLKSHRSAETEEEFRSKRRQFKQTTSRKYYEYLRGLIGDLKSNPKRFWSFLKSIKGKYSAMPVLLDGDRNVTSDVDKAELLNRAFSSKFRARYEGQLPTAPDYSLDPLREFTVTPEAVHNVLNSISPHKACGPDGVSARVIRECSEEITVPLTIICCLSLEQGKVPRSWKQANVIPVHKKGQKCLPTNYRSVSLLPLFSKVLERVVYSSLFNHVKPVLSSQQHGFMPKRSCVTNLATMLHEAWESISAGQQTDIIYTDYSAAFQSVDHALLLHKLRNSFKISDSALAWLESYFTERVQRVVINGKCSAWTPVPSGTPEGSLLSPLLFACFINDLPDVVHSKCLMFADDVKLYHRISCQEDCAFLQSQLDALCHWSKLWGMSLNPGKCKVLSFTLRRNRVTGSYVLGGEQLERVSEMRDLGVVLDEKLTFAGHIDCIVRKANRALGLLIRSFQTGRRGRSYYRCDSKAIIISYCANVRSILEYGSVIWGGAADTHLRRLEHIQHKFLTWLCARCRFTEMPLQYDLLERHFGLANLATRRRRHDLLFIRNVHRHAIDSPYLLAHLPLAVPGRNVRRQSVLHVPYARVGCIKRGLFVRLPETCNEFVNANREADLWHLSGYEWRRMVMSYAV